MPLLFSCSESSGIKRGGGMFETTSGTYKNAQSRASMYMDADAEFCTVEIPTATADVNIHWSQYNDAWDTDQSNISWTMYDGSGVGILRLTMTSNGSVGQLQYYNGSGWTNIGGTFDSESWRGSQYFVNIILETGTGGTVTVYFDNEEMASGSIGDSTGSFKSIRFENQDSTAHLYSISEVIIDSEGRSLFGTVVETEGPTADGTDSDGTGATGTYADVDEAVNDNGTTQLTLSTATAKHGFTSPARTNSPVNPVVLGVSVSAEMSRDASGPQQARFYLYINSTYYYGDTFALTTNLEPYHYVWNTNPDTGLAWTQSDAESASLEWGIEAVA